MQNKIAIIKFADVPLPKMRESKSGKWINYGDNNKYPNMLLEMLGKSSKHNGIVLGKVNYIVGQGFDIKQPANKYESLDEVLKKVALDLEVFGGYALEVHYNAQGQKAAFYHVPFHKVRTNKDLTQFFVKDWESLKAGEEPEAIPAYNPQVWAKETKQLLYFKEYRPGCEVYPLPGYVSALNAIKTDIEISKYHLSTISNGMFSSKLLSFYEGFGTDEEKAVIEKAFKNKFTGSENAGSIMLYFGKDPNKKPVVEDLSNTELDKHFEIMGKTIQQEIFVGHQVTSPMLFGIRVEGQLGGRSEMRDAYGIFKNTYINDKQQALEQVFMELLGKPVKIQPVEPVSVEFSEQTLLQIAPKRWLQEKAGIDVSQYPEEATQAQPAAPGEAVNENLKNLTGRQWQNVSRIIRKYTKGEINEEQARMLLKSALGLSDEEIDVMLSIDNTAQDFSADEIDTLMLAEFEKVGAPKGEWFVVQSHKAHAFADADPSQLETDVLDLIRKDKRVTPEVIAETLDLSVEGARSVLERLEEDGRVTAKAYRVGEDVIVERTLTEPLSKQSGKKPTTLDFKTLYSYEGPQDNRNRPFCKRMLELDRFYTRAEIETISRRLGYSVWDRKGGWWTQPDGTRSKSCRHTWKLNIVIKKK